MNLPDNAYIWDVGTGKQVRFPPIQWAILIADLTSASGGSGGIPPGSPPAPEWCSNRNVLPQTVRERGFKILSFGSYFSLCQVHPSGPYRLVFAACLSSWDDLKTDERTELTFWVH